MSGKTKIRVEVWFAVGHGYQVVAEGLSYDDSVKKAREYTSDARGVRLADRLGTLVQIKGK